MPCLLCCPLSASPPTHLSYTHLISPWCPVCCVVLFQPRLRHISLTHILFLHDALFVVLSSFSLASDTSLLHTSYFSMMPCLLCCPLSASPPTHLSYTHLMSPWCPVCCVVLFQPRLRHISLTRCINSTNIIYYSFSPIKNTYFRALAQLF